MENNTRGNLSGVDINRNFPTENWQKSTEMDEFFSGNIPASEPETNIIINLLEQYSPSLIIALHQPYKVINFDGPAENLAELMSQYNKYKVVANIGYPTPGSLGNYAGIERNIPTITLELPENEPDNLVWETNKPALIAVINNI